MCVVNDQGFAMHYRAFNAIGKFPRCERIKKDGLTSLLISNVLEEKIFQYDFLEGCNVRQNNRY